jgi:acyl-coenzyme A thioesterase PaaI-like protein
MATDAHDREPLAHLARLGAALRAVQDRVAHTKASAEVAADAAESLERVVHLLDPYRYDIATDRSWDDVNRAVGTRTLGPVLTHVVCDGETLQATVRFTPFYLGANGAVHGGILPLVFDEVLARLTNFDRTIGRTAYLNVTYRSVTLLERDITVKAELDRIDGRKRYARATLHDGEVLTAEATALYIELRPDTV